MRLQTLSQLNDIFLGRLWKSIARRIAGQEPSRVLTLRRRLGADACSFLQTCGSQILSNRRMGGLSTRTTSEDGMHGSLVAYHLHRIFFQVDDIGVVWTTEDEVG